MSAVVTVQGSVGMFVVYLILALIYLCSKENLLRKRRGDRNKDNLVPLPALPPNTCTYK